MVNHARLTRWLLAFQFLAVLAYGFSHLAVSLLKVAPPVFPQKAYMHAAVWGINFLFLSSGFLVHCRREELMPSGASWFGGTVAYLTSRFWLLAIPCYAAYLFDVGVLSFGDFGPSRNLALVSPALVTLSQTWIYALVGDTSLGLPLNGANAAWFGSCLLFTSIFYAVTRSVWSRMSGRIAVAVLVTALAIQVAQYTALSLNANALVAYDVANFSTKNPDYSLFSYFFQYSPYSYLASFTAGIALAEMHRQDMLGRIAVPAGLAFAALAMFLIRVSAPAIYLALNLALISTLAWLAGKADARTVATGAAAPGGSIWQARATVLLESAYVLLTLHLVMLLPFTAKTADYSFAAAKVYLIVRVMVVTLMMLLLCTGLHIYVFEPLRRAILARLDVGAGNDRFI